MNQDRQMPLVLDDEVQTAIYGSIYRAQVTEADGTRGVRAIKRLDKCLIAAGRTEAGLRARENVAMEVELLAMLRRRPHRHLLALGPLREQGHDHAHLSISVPFMEGGDLCSHVINEGRVSTEAACSVTGQLASALSHLHALGYAHCDVSLENLLLRQRLVEAGATPDVVLADYGAAAPFRAGAERCPAIDTVFPGYIYPHAVVRAKDVRCTRRVCLSWGGKSRYRPPESYTGHGVHGPDADAFGLGVCLFILLTGVAPFKRADLHDKAYASIAAGATDSLLRAWDLEHCVPAAAVELIDGLLCCSPSERWTVDQALRHEWLADTGDSEEEDLTLAPSRASSLEAEAEEEEEEEEETWRGRARSGAALSDTIPLDRVDCVSSVPSAASLLDEVGCRGCS